jgi:HSP20 family protein
MAIVRWTPAFNPARDLVSMQEDVNRFVDSFFSNGRRGDAALFTPTVDVEETAEGFVIKADLPGVSQKDVKVSLMGDTLVIRGERKSEKKSDEATPLRIERSYGMFERSFTLGAPVRSDQVKATYRDGVLEIHVPKAEEARLREIDIQVG